MAPETRGPGGTWRPREERLLWLVQVERHQHPPPRCPGTLSFVCEEALTGSGPGPGLQVRTREPAGEWLP